MCVKHLLECSLSLSVSASRDMKGRVAVEGGEDGTSQGGKSHDPPPPLQSKQLWERTEWKKAEGKLRDSVLSVF